MLTTEARVWTVPEVDQELNRILVEAIGVEEADITAEAALIDDLGAESIDFVDISFRMEQAFGSALPTRQWADAMRGETGQLKPAEIAEWLEKRHGLRLGEEDVKGLDGAGLKDLRERLQTSHGLLLPDDDLTELARIGVGRNAAAFERIFGLSISPEQFERLVSLARDSVFSSEFRRALGQVFTVGMLREFLLTRLGLATGP
jgi:acyl carrier protein